MPAMVATCALLHATGAVAVTFPLELPPQPVRITERAIEVTLDLPTPPIEVPAAMAADQAAQKLTPGSAEPAPAAPAPGAQDAAAAPPPAPREPDVALILLSTEPPPAISTRGFGSSTSPPART